MIRRLTFVLIALVVWSGACFAGSMPAIDWTSCYWKTNQSHGGNVIFSCAGANYVVLTDAGYLSFLAASKGITTASLTSVSIAGTALTATIASGTPANGDVLVGGGVSANSQLSSVSIVGSALTATVSVSQTVGPVAMTTTAARAVNDGTLAVALAFVANNPAAALSVSPTVWTGISALVETQTALAAGVAITCAGTPALAATYETQPGNFYYALLSEEAKYTAQFGAFSGGGGFLLFPARTGVVTIANVAAMASLWRGVEDYRLAWQQWVTAGGGAPTWGTGVCG